MADSFRNLPSFGGALPANIILDVANKCQFNISRDGLLINSSDTSTQANATGAYNGSGTGNKAFVSVMDWGGIALSALTQSSYTARCVRGTNSQLFFNVQVDLAGLGNSSDYALLIPNTTGGSFTLSTTGYTTLDFSGQSSSIWQCAGGSGPANVAGKAGIPVAGGGSYVTLNHILTYNPNAKLLNASIADNGQPKSTSLGAFQVVMNSTSATANRTYALYSVTINNKVYQFGE